MLTHAAPGHVSVTVKHGATTVAHTALLYCTGTVHIQMPIPANAVHRGQTLLIQVKATEDRSTSESELDVSAS